MERITRRRFLRDTAGLGAALSLPAIAFGAKPDATRLHGAWLSKYVEPLPVPGAGIVVATPSGANTYNFTQRQILRKLHPELPATPVWAYDDGTGLAGQAGSFGMAVAARRGVPITASFTNALPPTYPAGLPVDPRFVAFGNQVRVMTHLHGGFVAGTSDGNPAAMPDGFGPGQTQHVDYPNSQPATLLWFHDHGLGTTRLNVAAGLAGAYILRDQYDTGAEPNPLGVPGGAYEIPLVIQDRLFHVDGTFAYPVSDIPGVTWIGEYFGDVMLVNGKAWPYLEVEPRMYRLRVLNGCNARILTLDVGPLDLWQIGGDHGLLDAPVGLDNILLAPAERADILVDFSRFAGRTLVMKNHAPRRPVANPAPSLEAVMQIRVGTSVSHPGPRTIPASLPGERAALPAPVRTRFIPLNEVDAEEPGWFLNIGGGRFEAPLTEVPRAGEVEDWVYINMTGDTHPMHIHLVGFQVVGRTPFDVEAYEERYEGENGVPYGFDPRPFATGPMQPPAPEERGFKDTVRVNPGSFTTVRARFDLPPGVTAPQAYVHHCHILEHEDNDMMRPFVVMP